MCVLFVIWIFNIIDIVGGLSCTVVLTREVLNKVRKVVSDNSNVVMVRHQVEAVTLDSL